MWRWNRKRVGHGKFQHGWMLMKGYLDLSGEQDWFISARGN